MAILGLMSDIHLGQADYPRPTAIGADLLILAGDIANGTEGIDWASGAQRIAYIPGNHEIHGGAVPSSIAAMRHAASLTPNVTFIQNGAAVFDLPDEPGLSDGERLNRFRLRVLGCTLWTDFELYGDIDAAMISADARFTGLRKMRGSGALVSAAEIRALHIESRRFLETALAETGDWQATAVVTHHAPSIRSIHPNFQGDAAAPGFASDLESLIEEHQPDYWLHGHTHFSCDYTIGRTRILSRQRGYPGENPDFAPLLITL
jgi:predicted phosphodiesterase